MGRRKIGLPVRTSQLAVSIALELGLDPRDVRMVIEQLALTVVEHLVAGRRVHIDNLGSLTPKEMKGITRVRNLTSFKKRKQRVPVEKAIKVSFKKSARLKEELK